MTPQEIIKEIQKLPSVERKEILDTLSEEISDDADEDLRVQKALFDAGLLREIRTARSGKVADFKPIEIEGEPLSETIMRERR
jgi:hypothetical protein